MRSAAASLSKFIGEPNHQNGLVGTKKLCHHALPAYWAPAETSAAWMMFGN
jgi:hypothetical protein